MLYPGLPATHVLFSVISPVNGFRKQNDVRLEHSESSGSLSWEDKPDKSSNSPREAEKTSIDQTIHALRNTKKVNPKEQSLSREQVPRRAPRNLVIFLDEAPHGGLLHRESQQRSLTYVYTYKLGFSREIQQQQPEEA